MKTVKIISAISSTIIFALIALAINLEDPLKFKYRTTVDQIMESGIAESETELLEKYPRLKEVKENISKVDKLKSQICAKTSGNAPTLTKAEEIELEKMQNELLEMRQNAERLLDEMEPSDAIVVTP